MENSLTEIIGCVDVQGGRVEFYLDKSVRMGADDAARSFIAFETKQFIKKHTGKQGWNAHGSFVFGGDNGSSGTAKFGGEKIEVGGCDVRLIAQRYHYGGETWFEI